MGHSGRCLEPSSPDSLAKLWACKGCSGSWSPEPGGEPEARTSFVLGPGEGTPVALAALALQAPGDSPGFTNSPGGWGGPDFLTHYLGTFNVSLAGNAECWRCHGRILPPLSERTRKDNLQEHRRPVGVHHGSQRRQTIEKLTLEPGGRQSDDKLKTQLVSTGGHCHGEKQEG